MKTSLYKYLIVLVCFWQSPMHSQNYLKIWFKDGHTERHYMHLVQKISTSKYDLEGKLHSEYQIQQIVMADTTYSYYIADIDSMSFRKVDEEQVVQNVKEVTEHVKSLFGENPTIEVMESHLDEIKNLPNVDSVFSTGNDIVLQIKDWPDIVYGYRPKSSNLSYPDMDNVRAATRRLMEMKAANKVSSSSPLKVAIAFQMINDKEYTTAKPGEACELDQINHLVDEFEDMGFKVTFFSSNEEKDKFDVEFFEKRMFQYDIVIIATHGTYYHKKHGLVTGEKGGWLLGYLWDVAFDMGDSYTFYSCNEGESYKAVTEDFIKKSTEKFNGDGPHIVFIGACKTLAGNDIITNTHNGVPHNYYGSESVANIFFDKGADIVLGYNKGTSRAEWAAFEYFTYLLDGYSHDASFDYLYDFLKKEKNFGGKDASENAELIDLINPNSNHTDLLKFTLFKPKTVQATEQEIESAVKTNTVKVSGKFTACHIKENFFRYNSKEKDGSNLPPAFIKYGFRYGVDSNLERYEEVFSNNPVWIKKSSDNIDFSADIPLPPACGRVYYQAFTYDGIYYNLGDICYFDIPETVPDIPEIVPDLTYCPDDNHPHMIDLGTGVLWACCNVGATKPEEFGGHYAWGETEEKDVYHDGTYKWYNANYEYTKYNTGAWPGTVDNKTKLDPEDDVAHVKWGDSWRMPTRYELMRLTGFGNPKVTSKTETLNGVKGVKFTGSNGASIFLPYASARYDGQGIPNMWPGEYWASELNANDGYPIILYLQSGKGDTWTQSRDLGLSVRPVCDK